MSLLTRVAQKHCANYNNGICSGIDFDKKGKLFRFRGEGCACLLNTSERCSYFETAVLPMKTNEWKSSVNRNEFENAKIEYLRLTDKPIIHERLCPDCRTAPLESRQRFCEKCKDRRRKETDSRNHRNQRKSLTVRHTVNEK